MVAARYILPLGVDREIIDPNSHLDSIRSLPVAERPQPTKVFHLPWEYLDSSIGFRLQQSVPKGTQGATVNTLRVPEIHATKGMVDEQLIQMFESPNVPEPHNLPSDLAEGFYPNPNKPTLPELLKVQHRSLWLSIQKHLKPPSYPSPEAVVRLWHCRCGDDSVVYRQMLQRAFKVPISETLHDWLSAQGTEARSQAEGTSFGRVDDC